MNDYDRISAIEKAINDEQLDNAMDGYQQKIAIDYPALQLNEAFNDTLKAGQFMRALDNVRRARRVDGDEYFDVIRVLEFAAGKRIDLMMKGASNTKRM